ncbi:tetratricopeptide repeat protein [Streptomyces sp. NPDC048606]|uniref:serine/threonine-protein kinase n=1 Tax=Streptomyces sp. NPDC048606 TaxID=3154726 RepID=UPI00343036DF
MYRGMKLAGRYRLDSRLGHGGMGEVWAASDLRLRRTVAIKMVLASHLRDDRLAAQVLARFRREGEAAARLNHRNIAIVHDLGEHQETSADGLVEVSPFLVMEFLEGRDLATVLREDHPGGLPPEQVLEYGAQVCDGLAAAHAQNIVHRDIKPANLMLLDDGTVKICDFGIVQIQDGTIGLTAAGALLGSPLYMAPEQLRGQTPTHSADLYALGVSLYELLTGRPPFTADSAYAVIAMHLSTTPEPPSTHRPALPPGLDTLITSLLGKDPVDRPLTAKEVGARLRSAHLVPWPTTGPAAKAWETDEERHRRAAAAGDTDAMFNLALLLTEAGRIEEAETWYRRAAGAGNAGAMNNLGMLLEDAGRTDEAETWYHKAADTGNFNAMHNLGLLLTDAGRTDEAETWYRKAIDAGNTGAMHGLGLLLAGTGRTDEAETWYRKAIDAGNTGAMYGLGLLLAGTGRTDEAETWYRKAADAGNTDAMHNLGLLLEDAGRTDEAETWYRKAADTGQMNAMNNLGLLLTDTGRTHEAETWYRKAIDAGNTGAMHGLGLLLADTGRTHEAETWYRKAADAGNTDAMNNLGVLLAGTGRTHEAETWYRKAADTGQMYAMNNLGLLLTDTGRTHEAETWYRKAIDAGSTDAMHNLGLLLANTGRAAEAQVWYQRAANTSDGT